MCKLVKSLYRFKHASKQWHQKFEKTMLSNGFKINECDKCVYIKYTPNAYVIVCLYMDDMLIMGNSHEMLLNTKKNANKAFRYERYGCGRCNIKD